MPTQSSRAGIELNYQFSTSGKRKSPPESDDPFRILVLGDFGGRSGREANRRDLDFRARSAELGKLDALMAAFKPELELGPSAESPLPIAFQQLDDFHPDRLFESLDVFRSLRDLRRQLRDPRTANETAARIRGRAVTTAASVPAEAAATSEPTQAAEADRDTMARLFGRAPSTPAASATTTASASFVDAFIKPLVAVQVSNVGSDVQEVIESVDAALSALMRTILHHPYFRALEASWRGLAWLVERLSEGEDLKVFVVDVSKDELAQHLSHQEDLKASPLYELLTSPASSGAAGAPWALVLGDYTFEPAQNDADTLGKLAVMARDADAPLITASDVAAWLDEGASPSRAGQDAWNALRNRPESTYLGLALPGFLLRLPYGKTHDPIEGFAFEELATAADYSGCLWGNAATACAYLIGASFIQSSWQFSPGDLLEVNGLPVYVYREDGESAQAPCAERWLSMAKGEGLLGQGIMAFQAIRGRDAIRLTRFQSLHTRPTALAGRWA